MFYLEFSVGKKVHKLQNKAAGQITYYFSSATQLLWRTWDVSSTFREHLMLSCHLRQGWIPQLQTKSSPRDTSFLEQLIPKDRVRQGGGQVPNSLGLMKVTLMGNICSRVLFGVDL